MESCSLVYFVHRNRVLIISRCTREVKCRTRHFFSGSVFPFTPPARCELYHRCCRRRFSYQDMHDWLRDWPALALACGLPPGKDGSPPHSLPLSVRNRRKKIRDEERSAKYPTSPKPF